ncbi:DUF4190 domain-containing protein [Paenibacillus sp. NEAU-GSW1]|nr:DUF4190 domain-containing protein [Paenibacillus sp. NEAU-GSW1]
MPQPPKKTNGKSIAGLVLGICAIIVPYAGFIIGIIGIFLSSIALKEIKKSDEQGKGMAVAGLVCSIVGTVFYGVLIAALIILFFIGINVGSEYNEYNSNYNFGIANDFE